MGTQEPAPGVKIGGYTITRKIGHGSMATVYLAQDSSGHDVALKLFREGAGVSSTMLERFRREIEATKKLRRHPYILTVYSGGQDGPFHYIAMEFIPQSSSLEDTIDENLDIETAIRIVVKLLSALEYSHERNVIHRDLKPANIMMDDFGEPLLADFGVAELTDWPSLTVGGALAGTPYYMSPEQSRAEQVDRRSDVYSVGVLLFEMVTNELPYMLENASSSEVVLAAVRNSPPKNPRSLNSKITRDLEYILLKALSKDPKDRYASAKAFASDLECVLEYRPITARYFSLGYSVRYFLRKFKSQLLILTGVFFLSILGIYIYFKTTQQMHFEQMMNLARLKNAELVLEQVNLTSSGTRNKPAQVNQDIRLGRKALTNEEWDTAHSYFQKAAAISTMYRDLRTAAIARLEQARCEELLNNRLRAKELFMEILNSADASPAVRAVGHAEFIQLLVLDGVPEEAVEMSNRFATDLSSPYRIIIDLLVGVRSEEAFLELMANFPDRFNNDAYLALAVHNKSKGEHDQALEYLNLCQRNSSPRTEWPAPMVKRLRSEW